ncbi:MAG TPA: cobalt transport protein CbiN [Nitrospinota bacterium]|jgi:cobalt/nickel transport protein|nr:cobalt transport protein CbiN [Nitrospinota bacterium]|tara:strand:- start:55575 stop:55871 length:297 start_codon:yes stop_codon:yes gene_type:complete
MKNVLIIVACIMLLFAPSVYQIGNGPEEPFRGTDNQAADQITAIVPDYKPWWDLHWAPDSFLEGVLFTIEAALGAAVVGYVIGFFRGKNEKLQEKLQK